MLECWFSLHESQTALCISFTMEPTREKSVVSYDGHTVTAEDAVRIAQEEQNTKYSPWTKHMFRLYGVLALAYLCGCLNGFDGSLMGAINAMSQYQQYFGM